MKPETRIVKSLARSVWAVLRNGLSNSWWLVVTTYEAWRTPASSAPQPTTLWYIQTAYANPDGTFRRDPDRGPLWSDRAAMLEEMARHTGPGGCLNQWSPISTLGYEKPDEELHQWKDSAGTWRYFYVRRYRVEDDDPAPGHSTHRRTA